MDVPFPSLDKKNCLFCGKKVLVEAKICRYCHRWLDEVDRAVNDIDPEDLV
jgi:5'(3')-deoxyribonucleotidase